MQLILSYTTIEAASNDGTDQTACRLILFKATNRFSHDIAHYFGAVLEKKISTFHNPICTCITFPKPSKPILKAHRKTWEANWKQIFVTL